MPLSPGAIRSWSHRRCHVCREAGDPTARRVGGEAPTCLGSHRGAEEGLETGGTELADRPHAAEVRGQAGAGRGLAGAVWLGAGRAAAGLPLAGAREGGSAWGAPAPEPTRQPQPIPAILPAQHLLCSRAPAAGSSKPLRGRRVWEAPAAPGPCRLHPGSPLSPRGAGSGVFLERFYPSVLEH